MSRYALFLTHHRGVWPLDKMRLPVAGLRYDFSCTGFPRRFHFIARHLVWWLNGSLFLLTQLHHSGLCKLPCSSVKSLTWTNALCFRAIRKWEPYGGRLASVGRTTYPKGRMYIPFSWNKWVQSICLTILARWLLAPHPICSSSSIPFLTYSWYGMWGEVPPSPSWG